MTDCRLEDKLRELEILSLSETLADIGGRFDNKEAWYDPRTWGRSKVAPEPGSVGGTSEETDTNAHERMDTSELSTKLQEKEQHLIEKERDLQEREEVLRVEKEKSQKESELFLQEEKSKIQKENTDLQEREELLRVEKKTFRKEREQKLQEEQAKIQKEYARIQKEGSVLFVERDRLSSWNVSLERQAKDLELRRKNIQEREEKTQVKEGKYRARKEGLKDLTQSLELAQSSVEQEKKKSEELRKRVEVMDEASKENALLGLKLFVRMWKNEILDMIKRDKLRCIIPWDTSTWFKANYYKLDSARLEDLRSWLSDYLDVEIRDICIDIDIQVPRFVIFYLQSKLKKYATQYWNGNTNMALKNMHSNISVSIFHPINRSYVDTHRII
jgi:hypothetical protein